MISLINPQQKQLICVVMMGIQQYYWGVLVIIRTVYHQFLPIEELGLFSSPGKKVKEAHI